MQSNTNRNSLGSLEACQKEPHTLGDANQVQFDTGKEGLQILTANGDAHGEDFKILGVVFDVELCMHSAVDELVTAANCKLKMLVRTRRFYTDADFGFVVQGAPAFVFGVPDTCNLP